MGLKRKKRAEVVAVIPVRVVNPDCPIHGTKARERNRTGVASNAYLDGWDRIFGGRQTVGEA